MSLPQGIPRIQNLNVLGGQELRYLQSLTSSKLNASYLVPKSPTTPPTQHLNVLQGLNPGGRLQGSSAQVCNLKKFFSIQGVAGSEPREEPQDSSSQAWIFKVLEKFCRVWVLGWLQWSSGTKGPEVSWGPSRLFRNEIMSSNAWNLSNFLLSSGWGLRTI